MALLSIFSVDSAAECGAELHLAHPLGDEGHHLNTSLRWLPPPPFDGPSFSTLGPARREEVPLDVAICCTPRRSPPAPPAQCAPPDQPRGSGAPLLHRSTTRALGNLPRNRLPPGTVTAPSTCCSSAGYLAFRGARQLSLKVISQAANASDRRRGSRVGYDHHVQHALLQPQPQWPPSLMGTAKGELVQRSHG